MLECSDRRSVPAKPLSVLAVVAHPDDESFGLGAVLAAMHKTGASISVMCFTHGEASTLGIEHLDGRDLHALRAAELAAAAQALGVIAVKLLDHPDGQLATVPMEHLSDIVETVAQERHADLLLVFDEGGITGHPDHMHATRAALAAADRLDLPVLAWVIPDHVADQLNAEFATAFAGRSPADVEQSIAVDRAAQRVAIACHQSQSTTNPVLWKRLELTGDQEHLRVLRHPTGVRLSLEWLAPSRVG